MSTKRNLQEIRGDILAVAFNYFYDGWKYRIAPGKETYEEVAKDCKKSAKRLVDEYEEALLAEYNKK